jgi:hypothetical protein
MYCVQNTLSLKTHIKSKNETLALIDQRYLNMQLSSTTNTLRQIQDVIFTERTVPEKFPDWFSTRKIASRTDQLIISISNF